MHKLEELIPIKVKVEIAGEINNLQKDKTSTLKKAQCIQKLESMGGD
jgi:hypothetical protein